MSGLKVLPVRCYDRNTGKKHGCAFCGSDTKACGFHRGQLERALLRRQARWLVFVFLILAALACAAVAIGGVR